jgi:hypothetical protein
MRSKSEWPGIITALVVVLLVLVLVDTASAAAPIDCEKVAEVEHLAQ